MRVHLSKEWALNVASDPLGAHYLAPEIATGEAFKAGASAEAKAGAKADVYSLGVLLFELFNDNCSGMEARLEGLRSLRGGAEAVLAALPSHRREAAAVARMVDPDPAMRLSLEDVYNLDVIRDRYMPCLLRAQNDEIALRFLKSTASKMAEEADRLQADLDALDRDIAIVKEALGDRRACDRATPWAKDALAAMRSKMTANFDKLEASLIPGGSLDQRGDPLRLAQDLADFSRCSLEVRATLLGESGYSGSNAGMVCSIDFDKDHELFAAAAGVSRHVRVYDYEDILCRSGRPSFVPRPVVEMPCRAHVSCVSWSKFDKQHLASAEYDGRVTVWDASRSAAAWHSGEHTARVWGVDFSGHGKGLLASASDDRSVKFWSVQSSASVSSIQTRANVCCVKFSPGSEHVVALGTADQAVLLYDTRKLDTPLASLQGHIRAVSHVDFAEGGRHLVSASTDSTLKLWDVGTQQLLQTYSGHVNHKNFVGLDAGFRGYIACGSEDNHIYVYRGSVPVPAMTHAFGERGAHRDWGKSAAAAAGGAAAVIKGGGVSTPLAGHNFAGINSASSPSAASLGTPFISAVCVHPRDGTLLCGNSRGTIKLLEITGL